jgi:aerotaxis receptor
MEWKGNEKMKLNLPVSQIENHFSSDRNILSTTNLKGDITYVNDDFIEISGFLNKELIGQHHNMVRHPDMPVAAFADLWRSVKAGNSWMGIVKNRTKDGNHYWVDAYVTPIENNGVVTEYQSVRRKPLPEDVARADQLYASLKDGKKPSSLKPSIGLANRAMLAFLIPTIVAALSIFLFDLSDWASLAVAVAALLLAMSATQVVFRPFKALVVNAKSIIDDPVARYIYTGRRDDIGHILLAIKVLQSETAGLIGRIADSAQSLTAHSSALNVSVSDAKAGVSQQFAETDQVAAAVNEMSASVQEVSHNAQTSAEAALEGLHQVIKGKQVVTDSTDAMQRLKDEMVKASDIIAVVAESSENIAGILDVIGGVAEQTNLLALNAAIEAARAGDSGRGFAVVAAEVRTLASRTQLSTVEIRRMIDQLQTITKQAVDAMKAGEAQTDICVGHNVLTVESLDRIYTSIENINDMNTQIAAAVEQQSAVADEINRSVYKIRDLSEKNSDTVDFSMNASSEMLTLSSGFSALAEQFWTKQSA